jgi:Contractile injection system tube protein/LysM domain
MALTRVRIENLDTSPVEVIESGKDGAVFFNPNQYTLTKKVSWKPDKMPGFNVSRPQFDKGEPAQLAFSLLFDSYEARKDVRTLTEKVAKLTQVVGGKIGRPPVVKIIWGEDKPHFAGLPFTGVVESVTQKFTLFLDDGTPVRATLDLSLHETRAPEKQQKEMNKAKSSPLQPRMWTVKQGDSLWAIAASEYLNAALWREIARANGVRNPRDLVPGTVLLIPSIE